MTVAHASRRRGNRPGMLAGYAAPAGAYDELRDTDGHLKPAYARLVRELERLGPDEFRRRWDAGRRLLLESGVSYTVYGDPRGHERPWELDPIPFLITPEEWREIEAGLIQRARLFNALLADCYGPQQLMRSGHLPGALVLGQPGFLRPCHGLTAAAGVHLQFYAVDLARAPDGQWWVISDRTQVPTGAGYALENRLAISRLLPDLFGELQVERLAGFFRAMQESLVALAAPRTNAPRIVLLTPGPFNETYFEQSYLARYLGFTLAEGEDLTVSGDRVYLKTLSGPEPVDVIGRRVDDDFCDPLELRRESLLGVPGLVQAVRAGQVAVANMLGSALVQSPALMAFLPGLCRAIFDEDLKLPSVATWWCGHSKEARYVAEHLHRLVVKPAFPDSGQGVRFGSRLSAAQREDLGERIRFQPWLFIAQEAVTLSAAPAWSGTRLLPGPVALRLYLVATGDTYKVMPGGLTRVAASMVSPSISMQRGGVSKDTWVLSPKPVENLTLLHGSGRAVELRRTSKNLSSRVASNLFWLGRYAERAEATARLVRSALTRLATETGGTETHVLLPLLQPLAELGQLTLPSAHLPLRQRRDALARELLLAVSDPERPGSLRALTTLLQELAVRVRDRLSVDTCRLLRHLFEDLMKPVPASPAVAGELVGSLNTVILDFAALSGLATENLTRAQGWRFQDIGRRIERGVYQCALLGAALRAPDPASPGLLEALLEVADSAITYRSRYTVLPQPASVFDLLLLDEANPRALVFQLDRLADHLGHLPDAGEEGRLTPAQLILVEAKSGLRLLDPRDVDDPAARENVAARLAAVGVALPRLSDALNARFFAYAVRTPAVAPALPPPEHRPPPAES